MDEDPAPSDRRRRALPLIAAAAATILITGFLYLHPISLSVPASRISDAPPHLLSGKYSATYDFFTPYLGWALVLDYGSFSIQLQTRFMIFKTTDGAAHWVQQFSGSAFGSRNYLHFFNGQEGFAYAGLVYRTVDGGAHWTAIKLPEGAQSSVTFASPTLGWAVASQIGNLRLLRTSDGGLSWVQISDLPSDVVVEPLGSDQPVMFSPTGVGWLGAGLLPAPAAYATVDLGLTWRKVDLPASHRELSPYMTSVLLTPDDNALIFVRDQSGTLVEVLRSTANTSVWLVVQLPSADALPGDLSFGDGRNWWLIRPGSGSVFRTADAGATWVGVAVNGVPAGWSAQSGQAIDAQHGWWGIVSQKDSTVTGLLMSSDGGAHWRMVNAPQP